MRRRIFQVGLSISVLGALAVLTVTLAQGPARHRYVRSSVLVEEARRCAEQGRWVESRQRVDEAYALCPENPKVHRERGMQLMSQQQIGPATEELRLAAEGQPGDAGAAWEMAFALSAAGQAEESIKWFDRVSRLEPGNGVAYAMIATGHLQRNRLPEALAAAQTGVHLSPRVSLTWLTLGLVYWQEKQFDQARAALEQASALRPSDLRTLLALGAVSAEARRFDRAVTYFERAVRVAPHSRKAWRALGEAYRLAGRSQEAGQALLRAGQRAPSVPLVSQTAPSR